MRSGRSLGLKRRFKQADAWRAKPPSEAAGAARAARTVCKAARVWMTQGRFPVHGEENRVHRIRKRLKVPIYVESLFKFTATMRLLLSFNRL